MDAFFVLSSSSILTLTSSTKSVCSGDNLDLYVGNGKVEENEGNADTSVDPEE